jgi:hypothetical protein
MAKIDARTGSTAFTPSGQRPFMADGENRRAPFTARIPPAVNGARPDGVNAVLPDPRRVLTPAGAEGGFGVVAQHMRNSSLD